MVAPTTLFGSVAPKLSEKPTFSPAQVALQRECTLCGRTVTNCAAHSTFFAGEAISVAGIAYSVYASSPSLGIFSGAGLFAMVVVQGCWLRFRNVRALSEAANDVGDAADAAHGAVRDLEAATGSGETAASHAAIAASRVLSAAQAVERSMGAGHVEEVSAGVEEAKAMAAGTLETSMRFKGQIDELKTLLIPCSALMHSVKTSLVEINRGIRSSSPQLDKLAALQTRFEASSNSMQRSLTGGLEEFKQVLAVLSETAVLSMEIMRENIARLEDSLVEKNAALAIAVSSAAGAAEAHVDAMPSREVLIARLEALQRDNDQLQLSISNLTQRLEFERIQWIEGARHAAVELTATATGLSAERMRWEGVIEALRVCSGSLEALHRENRGSIEKISSSMSEEGK